MAYAPQVMRAVAFAAIAAAAVVASNHARSAREDAGPGPACGCGAHLQGEDGLAEDVGKTSWLRMQGRTV